MRKAKENVIEIKEEFTIGDYIIEKGDVISINEDAELDMFVKSPVYVKLTCWYAEIDRMNAANIAILGVNYNGDEIKDVRILEDPNNPHGFLAKKLFYNFFKAYDTTDLTSKIETYLSGMEKAGFEVSVMENSKRIILTNRKLTLQNTKNLPW